MVKKRAPFRVALLCGGPSPERGISLNSARSVSDHLEDDSIEIVPIYFDLNARSYLVSRGQLYSNTPSDFDFKLKTASRPLSTSDLVRTLRKVDLALPIMHGRFGEDGGIQSLLERHRIPYWGAPASTCRVCFDKHEANEKIRRHGFFALPSIALKRADRSARAAVQRFFRQHKVERAVVKPASGGSSIGVFSVASPAEAMERARHLLGSGQYRKVVVEPFCQGVEFTSVILENRYDVPVCLLPVEIEADYSKHQIFDYRKKYLPTRQVTYHCPPRFSDEVIERIQIQAEQLFSLFGMRDFARFDGWYRPDGSLWFSDFNPISGMEQNSFLFLQGARLGMSHRDVLRYIVTQACRRRGIEVPRAFTHEKKSRKSPVSVVFGGRTSERQVSLMSGTNVWLKLRRSSSIEPRPFLLDAAAGAKSDTEGTVWEVPYALALNHTVEEVAELCRSAHRNEPRLAPLRERVRYRLAAGREFFSETEFLPRKLTVRKLLKESRFVFLALHGGDGENGVFQALLERSRVPFNGSGSGASKLAMDKFATGAVAASMERHGISTVSKIRLELRSLRALSPRNFTLVWRELREELGSETILVKPSGDGCSAGVVRLSSARDLRRYVHEILLGTPVLAPGTIAGQGSIIEMPASRPAALLFETFIETDRVEVRGLSLRVTDRSGWVEVTVGVLGARGKMRALNPSVTVASGDVLTVEEKFQGGTGINMTPPPAKVLGAAVTEKVKQRIERVANALGLEGYARIDAFVHRRSGEVLVIEANTLPALTPSTVIFHQALAEPTSRNPRELLEEIVRLGKERYGRVR